jgi:hypothetical protein
MYSFSAAPLPMKQGNIAIWQRNPRISLTGVQLVDQKVLIFCSIWAEAIKD